MMKKEKKWREGDVAFTCYGSSAYAADVASGAEKRRMFQVEQ